MKNDEMKEIVICCCGHQEYYGMMHWLSGETRCRECIYKLWSTRTKWKPTETDYVFPIYSDGKNYIKGR